MKRQIGIALTAFAVASAMADHEWKPEDGSVSLGAVTVTADEDSVSFAGAAGETCTYDGPFLPSKDSGTWGIVKADARLSDYEVLSTTYSGQITGTAKPSHVVRDADTMSLQLLTYAEASAGEGATKGVKLVLRQEGDDIVGQVQWAKYCVCDLSQDDWDKPNRELNNFAIRVEGTTGGYGINNLTMRTVVAPEVVRLPQSVPVSSLAAGGAVNLLAETNVLVQPDGALPAAIDLNGGAKVVAKVGGTAPVAVSGTLSGTGGELALVTDPGEYEAGDFRTTLHQVLTVNYEDNVIPNTRLADVTGMTGWMSGKTLFPPEGFSSPGYFFVNDGVTASCQFQLAVDGAIKCVMIDLEQQGTDIRIKTFGAPYMLTGPNDRFPQYNLQPGVFRFTAANPGSGWGNVATAWDALGYCVTNLELAVKSRPGSYSYTDIEVPLVLSATCSSTDAKLTFAGAEGRSLAVTVSGVSAFPVGPESTVEVGSNAVVDLTVPGADMNTAISGGLAKLVVRKGGELRQRRTFNIGTRQTVELDGGRLHFGYGFASTKTEAETYVRDLHYRNGAVSTGLPPRIGFGVPDALVQVRGNEPSVSENGFWWIFTLNGSTHVFDVADVTGGVEADFTVRGPIAYLVPDTASYCYGTFVKRGSGTLRLEDEFSVTRNPARITDGTLELGASGILTAQNNFTLEGGTLSAAAKTVNVCGTLKLTANSAVDVASDATLDFQSFAGWTENARLTLTVAEGGRVHVGSAPSALLRRTSYNGKRCHIDENGYQNGDPQGLVLILR